MLTDALVDDHVVQCNLIQIDDFLVVNKALVLSEVYTDFIIHPLIGILRVLSIQLVKLKLK